MKQHYIFLLDALKSSHPYWCFICNRIDFLMYDKLINVAEHEILFNDFQSRYDDAEKMFWDNPSWLGADRELGLRTSSWWCTNEYAEEGKRCRIKFIESIIESL